MQKIPNDMNHQGLNFFVRPKAAHIEPYLDQVTLAQMSDPPRLTRPARTPSTVSAPPLSPYRFTISLMESFEILTFSSLDSFLSRCRLHKACPH